MRGFDALSSLPFFAVVALFAGVHTLTIGSTTQAISRSAITIALFWQAGVWAAAGSLGIIGFILNVAIWAFVGNE